MAAPQPHLTADTIDWDAIASKTRAEKGDAWVEQFGDRYWQAMMTTAGVLNADDAAQLHFGDKP